VSGAILAIYTTKSPGYTRKPPAYIKVFSVPGWRVAVVVADTASVPYTGRRRAPMCYTRKEWTREEEARRSRTDEAIRAKRREEEAPHAKERKEKPLTEKVKEVVGVR
jgi:hypothetical protein